MQSKFDRTQLSWEIPPDHESYLHLRIRRSTFFAFLGSLIFHALVLFVVPQQREGSSEPPATANDSLKVNLRPRLSAQDRQSAAPVVEEAALPARATPRPAPSASAIIAANKPRPPEVVSKPASPTVAPPAVAEPIEDMQAYVNAARARRRSAEGFSPRETPASVSQDAAEDEMRMARVKRNLHQGTNGMFQILSVGSRQAAFSFRGWTTDQSNSRREYIQVDIGANSDIEIAIVRKMIELIRRYQQEDFNWESDRLNRVVTLSARQEDNAGLEEFLLKEFFVVQSRSTRFQH